MSSDDETITGADNAALATMLTQWLPHQRWFAGSIASDVSIEDRRLVATDVDGALLEHVVIGVGIGDDRTRYQLWTGWRGDLPDRLGHSVIGRTGDRTAYDALYDGGVSALLLSLIAGGEDRAGLTFRPEPDAAIDTTARGLVIGAEQSNTSIVYGDSAILKVFRRLQPGTNPDVEVHRALHAAGSTHIDDPLGEISGPVGDRPTTLGLLTRFFANSAEGWAMATASVRDLMAEGDLHADEVGGDFAAEAHRLGRAVGAVHADLAAAFGTHTGGTDELSRTISEMTAQAQSVAVLVPELAVALPSILAAFEAARASAGLTVQRIHGDLHLGQTLRTLTGWTIIDFEGEPAKSLAYRRGLHSPLRDIAGMLRSFDYAAHHLLVGSRPDAQHNYRAAEWATRNGQAFCDGYAEVAGTDPRDAGPLLRAYEIDKAVYEVQYEHGHRPSWVPVPMQAIAALTSPGGKR